MLRISNECGKDNASSPTLLNDWHLMQKPRIEDIKIAWLNVQRRGLNVVLREVLPEHTTGEGARRL